MMAVATTGPFVSLLGPRDLSQTRSDGRGVVWCGERGGRGFESALSCFTTPMVTPLFYFLYLVIDNIRLYVIKTDK